MTVSQTGVEKNGTVSTGASRGAAYECRLGLPGKTCVVVLLEGLATDSSGASSACSVASQNMWKHTCVFVYPDPVCYLNSAW